MGITNETIAAIQGAVEPKIIPVNDVEYSTLPLIDVRKPEPTSTSIEVAGLAGIVEYIQTHDILGSDAGALITDEHPGAPYVVHVADYNSVKVMSHPFGRFKQRDYFAHATAPWPDGLKFGKFIESEIFVIQMMSLFFKNEASEKIIQLLTSITSANVSQHEDDGAVQQVVVKKGVVLKEAATVPNPVSLAPFRSFREIEQPASLFVFRAQTGERMPECALFEADGGRWKIEAIDRIKTWLKTALGSEIDAKTVHLIG